MELEAETLGQLLGTLAARCPALSELIASEGLHPSVVANLNGDRVRQRPAIRGSREDDRLLILSADAGG